jgi:hypothetical protein
MILLFHSYNIVNLIVKNYNFYFLILIFNIYLSRRLALRLTA